MLRYRTRSGQVWGMMIAAIAWIMQYKPVQALWLSSPKWLKGALLKEAWLIKPTTALLEFQPSSTQATPMKASEPEKNLSVDWFL